MTHRVHVQRAFHSTHQPEDDSFQQWVMQALAAQERECEINIRIVDEAESAQLNATYRHKDRPTNVLSFPVQISDELVAQMDMDVPLGDLVICAPVVEREAAEQGKSVLAHWAHMTIHGTLHLLGFDHLKDEEAAVMEAKEIFILASLGFANPYEITHK